MMLFIISLFSVSPMQVTRHLPYVIKDNSNEGPIKILSYLLTYTAYLVLIT